MKWFFYGLVALLVLGYVLTASGAVEFQTRTLEQTDWVERRSGQGSFHPERIPVYLKKKAEQGRSILADIKKQLSS